MSKIIKYCLGSEYSDQELLKDALWKIWQDIFHDTDEYLTLFFKDKYHSDRVYLACQEEKISSCVHSVDYKFNLFGQVIDSTYTTAGATLPAYKGQGIYDNLFDYCLNQMVNHNIVLTTLIIQDDWLYNFYKRLRYSDVFKKKQTQLYPSKSGTYIEDRKSVG